MPNPDTLETQADVLLTHYQPDIAKVEALATVHLGDKARVVPMVYVQTTGFMVVVLEVEYAIGSVTKEALRVFFMQVHAQLRGNIGNLLVLPCAHAAVDISM